MSVERPSKRHRSAAACRRCKHRKQRCDNEWPACSNCTSANQQCHYEGKVHPPEYVNSLEQRVEDLERLLNAQTNPSNPYRPTSPITHVGTDPSPQAADPSSLGHHANDVPADTGFNMLSSSSYLGTSSGYPLAKAVHAVIGPPNKRHGENGLNTPPALEPDLPDKALGRRLIQVYLSKVHPKHPFLSAKRILQLHDARESLQKSPDGRPRSIANRLNSFLLCMVYTIGARYHQLAQNVYTCSPDTYHAAAMQDVDCLSHGDSLETMEGMLLLVIFQLRSSRAADSIWQVVGLTMRHAVSLGLHRKFNGPRVLDQRRKRIFWTIYMLERSIARTMGRPMSISDRDIDVELPANVDEEIESESEMAAALQTDRGPTTRSAVVHIFRLSRLESQVYSAVHRVDRPVGSIKPGKLVRLRQSIEEWRNDIALYVPHADNDADKSLEHYYATSTYHILHYHLALLLLLLPTLTTLPSDHPDFKTCVTSAGQVCQHYKRLHDRQSVLSYSIIALQATFVAGLTLVYCFIADPSILTVQFNSDIRACSTVLYVISERWPAACKVRDAFERMLDQTIEAAPPAQPENHQADDAMFESIWAELAVQFDQEEVTDRGDIWNALGPWFDMSDEGLQDGTGQFYPSII